MDTNEIAARVKANEGRKKEEKLSWLIEKIRKNMDEIGLHLQEIRDGKLYENRGFSTFEDFCQATFGFGNKRANQLISSDNLRIKLGGEIGDEPEIKKAVSKMKEGQLREITGLPKEKQIEVLREAIKAPKITAVAIKRAKARVIDGVIVEPPAKKCPHCGGSL